MQTMRSPLENYRPPTLSDMLPDELKDQLLSEKAERLALAASDTLAEGTELDDFLERKGMLDFDFDCRELEPFCMPHQELPFFEQIVVSAYQTALFRRGIETSEAIGLRAVYAADNPRRAELRMVMIPEDLRDNS